MVDVVAFDDLDSFGEELDDPLEELLQDLYHRLLEPPGSNLDDPDRGLGLEDALSAAVDVATLSARIEAEFRKDDRVSASRVTITETAPREYLISIDVEPDVEVLGLTGAQIARLAVVSNDNGIRRVA